MNTWLIAVKKKLYPFAYVQVRPKPELVTRVFELTSDRWDRETLTSDFVWGFESEIEPRNGLFVLRRIPEHIYEDKVRIIHLAHLYYDCVEDIINPNEPISLLVKSLIGLPPFKVETFDKWWTLHHLGAYNSIQYYEKQLPKGSRSWFTEFDEKWQSEWWSEIFEKKDTE